MTNEIKEILEYLKDLDIYVDEHGYCYKRLSLGDDKLLLDYITNLQEIEKEHQKINGELRQEITNLQQRIDKAVEYITSNDELYDEYQHIINILRGDE